MLAYRKFYFCEVQFSYKDGLNSHFSIIHRQPSLKALNIGYVKLLKNTYT